MQFILQSLACWWLLNSVPQPVAHLCLKRTWSLPKIDACLIGIANFGTPSILESSYPNSGAWKMFRSPKHILYFSCFSQQNHPKSTSPQWSPGCRRPSPPSARTCRQRPKTFRPHQWRDRWRKPSSRGSGSGPRPLVFRRGQGSRIPHGITIWLFDWWFGIWNMFFPYIGKNNPNWLISFRGVDTTNQLYNSIVMVNSGLVKALYKWWLMMVHHD